MTASGDPLFSRESKHATVCFCTNPKLAVPPMRKVSLIAVVLLFGLVGAGALFLTTWDIPAPSAPVEKVISNERFPR